jgi:hypothetical protein
MVEDRRRDERDSGCLKILILINQISNKFLLMIAC